MENNMDEITNGVTMIYEPMTTETAAQITAVLLHSGRGRLNDEGDPTRPWMYVNVENLTEARDLQEAFGRGFAKITARGGRYGAWGNDALELFEHLLSAGLSGWRGERAGALLEKYGNDGKPWGSEMERLRACARGQNA